MEKINFAGVWTALITPFKADQAIDYEAWDKMLDKQIGAGVTGVLVAGTTGESPTLESEEKNELLKHTVEYVAGQCLVMMGSGSNSTKHSIEASQKAGELGADVVLLVNPYYNKPTQEGLYQHFSAIARAISLPVVLYNIKGRTGVNLATATLQRLIRDNQNIIGVKEASGDLRQIEEVCQSVPSDFTVLSGDDGITYKIMHDFGAKGIISVASNVIPEKLVEMVNLAAKQQWTEAEALDQSLQEFFKGIFVETNPIPVKYAAAKLGMCQPVYRLPMCPISSSGALVVDNLLTTLNLAN